MILGGRFLPCSLPCMVDETHARSLQRLLNQADGEWGNIDIWPKQGPTVATAGHIFLSSVLSITGTDEAKFASWTTSESGSLAAAVWTEDLAVLGSRSSADDQIVTVVQTRASLRAIRVLRPPVLSMSGWGVQASPYVAELVYPEFTAQFRRRSEEPFLEALASFKRDL